MSDIDMDALVDRIKAALGAGARRDDDDGGGGRGRVPYDRFDQVRRERDEARRSLEELGGQVQGLRAQHASALDEVRENAASQFKALQLRHNEDLSLTESGFRDPLGRAALRGAYDALPKGERPSTMSEWWNGLLEARTAHASDGEAHAAPSIPATLQGYLPAAPAPPPEVNGGSSRSTRPPPRGPAASTKSSAVDNIQASTMQEFFAGLRGLGAESP